jgi:hypothetical protein
METKTRVKKAITYIEGAMEYLSNNPSEWSIKQATSHLKNARTLLKRCNLTSTEKLISEIKELIKEKEG